jgi:nucleoside-diphosphate-sugar epimerase
MKVFVTGVSGYAGFYGALRLAAAGHAVTGLIRHPDQPRLNMLRVQEVRLVTGDVGDVASYRAELEGSDVVIHTMLDKRNPQGTDRALFAVLKDLPVRNPRRRFIYTTGCSIFGKLPILVMDETVEPNPAHPLSFRRTMEKEALTIPNISTVVLRPGFMYGNDGYNSVSADWFAMAKTNEVIFRGDQERGWSWIHITDLAEAYRLAVDADDSAVAGEVFHLGDALRPRSLDVMRACIAAAGYKGEVRCEGPLKGDNISTWFNQNEFMTSQKARDRLGWRPQHAGIIECVNSVHASWLAAQNAA